MTDVPPPPPAGWHPDPTGRHPLRWWDGSRWTEHVSSGSGEPMADPLGVSPPGTSERDATRLPVGTDAPERVRRQVEEQAGVSGATASPGGGLFDQRVLVVNQKAKLIELNNEYAIYDAEGRQVGAVRQVGQSALRKAIRLFTSYDQFLTHRLQVLDERGTPVLDVTRPRKLVKSRVIVARHGGGEIGMLRQENAVGKIRFALEAAGGGRLGTVKAENWRAWDFAIEDASGTEVARIKKTWEGLAKTMFTTADNYVVRIHRDLEDPLRSLVVAAAVSVDTALKQDSRGFG